MALSSYNKQALDISGQVQRLIAKGMHVADQRQAENFLERVGYYHLSAYWHPFKDHSQDSLPRNFQHDTKFDDVIAFYQFDTKLRNNLLFGLGRIEIGLRASLVNFFASKSADAYLDLSNYSFAHKLTKKTLAFRCLNPFDGMRKCWSRLDSKDCVQNYKDKYQNPPPIWTIAETWDWGTLSSIIFQLNQKNSQCFERLIQKNLPFEEHFLTSNILASWLKSLNALRNYCAHQERIWNRDYTFRKPQEPRQRTTLKTLYPSSSNIRLHHLIVVMCGFQRLFKIDDVWFEELMHLLENAPKHPLISYSRAGFASNWTRTEQQLEALKLWMNQ